MEISPFDFPTTISATWNQQSLKRLRRVLELTSNEAPRELSQMEAFALIEWCRIAAYADCHAAGVGPTARVMLRGVECS